MNFNYNLLDEKWIPCVMKNKEQKEINLRETLINSNEIKEIFDPSPIVTISLYRLILAILYRVYSSNGYENWKKMWINVWGNGVYHADKLNNYLDKWHHRFNLFDNKRPFYQYPEIEGNESPVDRLALEAACGNNPTLFSHNNENMNNGFDFGTAARNLIAHQSFSIGFGKSSPFYLKDSPLIRGVLALVKGDSLFETLMLNFAEPYLMNPQEDKPIWEESDLPEPKEDRISAGYLQYLTWMSRRILLIPSEDKKVKRIKYQQGVELSKNWREDLMKSYLRDEKRGKIPLRMNENKELWRDSHNLFAIKENDSKPETFNFLSILINQKVLTKRRLYQYEIFGLCTEFGKAASVLFWRQENLPLPLSLLTDEKLVYKLKEALKSAEKVGEILRASVSILADELNLGKDEKQKLRKKILIDRQYWAELSIQFRFFVIKLAENEEAAMQEWITSIRRCAIKAFKNKIENLGTTARILKAVNSHKVTGYFYGSMKKELEGFELFN
jgi:CRISPR system Cascade subunit CasA